jgi:hypothetical protein
MVMKRGKQLDSCVFYFFNDVEPTITRNNKIHKIVYNDFFIQNELTNQRKLITIQNHKEHFYLCENASELKITQMRNEDTYIHRNYVQKDNTILLAFEDRNLLYFKDYIKTLHSPNAYILTVINSYKHLLHSLQLLVGAHIFHNHIQLDSIMVDNTDFLLSNFSVSIDYSHSNMPQYINRFILAYEPSYVEWSIEFHILSYLLTNKLHSLSEHNIETIIGDYLSRHTILQTFGPSLVSSYKSEGIQYFKKYVNQSYEYIVTDVLQYASTWDNYALSILFLRILIGIHRTIKVNNKFILLFMKLLVSNLHINPLKRETIDTTIQKFDCLLDSLEPKDYTEVIHLMSA